VTRVDVIRQFRDSAQDTKKFACAVDAALDLFHASVWEARTMLDNSELLRLQPNIFVNAHNVAYIELTGKGGADIHFVGKAKALHLNATEAEALRDYLSGDKVRDIGKAA